MKKGMEKKDAIFARGIVKQKYAFDGLSLARNEGILIEITTPVILGCNDREEILRRIAKFQTPPIPLATPENGIQYRKKRRT